MSENTIKDLQEVSKDVKSLVEKMRERDEKLSESEKKLDGELKELTAKAEDQAQKLSDLTLKLEEEKKEREALEKLYNEPKGDGEDDKEKSEYKKALNSYIRKGIEISEEMAKKGVEEVYGKNFKNIEEKEYKHLIDSITKECGDNKGYIMESKTLRTNVNPDGGYWVQPVRGNTPVIREFETSPMRQLAETVSISSNEYELVLDDDESTSGGWVSEEEARSNTATPKIGLLKFPVHEQYANPKVTQKMLDDAAFNIEGWLSNKTNDIITRTENTAFINGDGNKKPKGILSYSNWAVADTYERNKVEQINSGVNGQFVADTIIDIQNTLKPSYQANAIWGIKRQSWREIAKLKDGQGRYLLDMDAFKNGFMLRLLGKPVIFMTDMDAIATDALAMVYGDFRQAYVIVDRLGLRVLRDPYTSKPYVQFYTTKRVGGGVKNFEAYKIYKLAA